MRLFNSFISKDSPKKENINTTFCPYCNHKLDKFPTRKSACSFCKNIFFVRTNPITNKKVILTEKELERNEKEWRSYYNASEFERKLNSTFDIGKYPFNQLKDKIKLDLLKKFGREPSLGDSLWGLSNALIIEAIEKRDYDFLSHIYWCQSYFLYIENKNYIPTMELFFEIKLKQYQSSGFESVEIITCGEQSCTSCQKLEGKVINITDALATKPLPCKDCTFDLESVNEIGWCRCAYGPHIS